MADIFVPRMAPRLAGCGEMLSPVSALMTAEGSSRWLTRADGFGKRDGAALQAVRVARRWEVD
jgi:hypothetical protein